MSSFLEQAFAQIVMPAIQHAFADHSAWIYQTQAGVSLTFYPIIANQQWQEINAHGLAILTEATAFVTPHEQLRLPDGKLHLPRLGEIIQGHIDGQAVQFVIISGPGSSPPYLFNDDPSRRLIRFFARRDSK